MDVSTAGAEDDAAAAAASGPSSSDAKVSLYDKMISALSDARAHVRNAQKSVSGESGSSWRRTRLLAQCYTMCC